MTADRLPAPARTPTGTATGAPTGATSRADAARPTPLVVANIALRALMEFGLVVALGLWGFHLGSQLALPLAPRLALALALPTLGFGFWGAVDFRGAGRLAEPLRLLQELGLTGVAAAGLALTGLAPWGAALAALSIVHHALVYALDQRLLKD